MSLTHHSSTQLHQQLQNDFCIVYLQKTCVFSDCWKNDKLICRQLMMIVNQHVTNVNTFVYDSCDRLSYFYASTLHEQCKVYSHICKCISCELQVMVVLAVMTMMIIQFILYMTDLSKILNRFFNCLFVLNVNASTVH